MCVCVFVCVSVSVYIDIHLSVYFKDIRIMSSSLLVAANLSPGDVCCLVPSRRNYSLQMGDGDGGPPRAEPSLVQPNVLTISNN